MTEPETKPRRGRPPTKPQTALPGDHDVMTEPQKRSHYSKGCRHDVCRTAVSTYQRERNRRLAAERSESVAKLRATTTADLDHAPSREPMVSAEDLTDRVPALGATRRIQGLLRVGHSPVQIARRTQVGVDAVWWLALGRVDDIARVTDKRIDDAFRSMREQLPAPMSKTKADGDRITAMCRELALENAWAGPFDWFDIDRDDKPTHTPRSRPTEATP